VGLSLVNDMRCRSRVSAASATFTRTGWKDALGSRRIQRLGHARTHISRVTAKVGTSSRVRVPRTARDAGLALASRVRAKRDGVDNCRV
jgi:hypothetical protein